MNRKEIDKLWNKAIREAIDEGCLYTRYHFAELVAAAEREACAKVCEDESGRWAIPVTVADYKEMWAECAAAIRARGLK